MKIITQISNKILKKQLQKINKNKNVINNKLKLKMLGQRPFNNSFKN